MNRAELYQLEYDQLFNGRPEERPELAIELCIGRNGVKAPQHNPFVVYRYKNGKQIEFAEFGNLEDAKELIPVADCWPSSTVCYACSQLTWDEIDELQARGNPYNEVYRSVNK